MDYYAENYDPWSVHVKFILLSFHVMLVLHLPKYSSFAESVGYILVIQMI
jgi:hypothetical protein